MCVTEGQTDEKWMADPIEVEVSFYASMVPLSNVDFRAPCNLPEGSAVAMMRSPLLPSLQFVKHTH